MKTNDLKRQLAAVTAVALTFSSMPASVGAVNVLGVPSTSVEETIAVDTRAAEAAKITATGGIYDAASDTLTLEEGAVSVSLACLDAVEYTASVEGVVTVAEGGAVTVVAPGTTVISAVDDKDAVIDTITVIVKDSIDVTVSVADFEDKDKNVKLVTDGGTSTLTVPANQSITAAYLKEILSGRVNFDIENATLPTTDVVAYDVALTGSTATVTAVVKTGSAGQFTLATTTPKEITVVQEKTTLTAIPAITAPTVTVKTTDDVKARETAARTAVLKAVYEALGHKDDGESYFDVVVTAKGAEGDKAREEFDVDVKLDLGQTKYKFADGTEKLTATVKVTYVADKVTINPEFDMATIADGKVFKSETKDGNTTHTYTATVPVNENDSQQRSTAAKALAELFKKNTEDDKGGETLAAEDWDVAVNNIVTTSGGFTCTVDFVLKNTDKWVVNSEAKVSVPVTVVLKVEQISINPSLSLKTGEGGATIEDNKLVVKATGTADEKKKAAIAEITKYLVIDKATEEVLEADDYTITVEPHATEADTFVATLKVTDTRTFTGKLEVSKNIVVKYVASTTAEKTTIKPAITGEDKYTVNVPANYTSADKAAYVEKYLEEFVKVTGVDGLKEGEDYDYTFARKANESGATVKAIFTLKNTDDYVIDSAIKTVDGLGIQIVKEIAITYTTTAVDLTPVMASALKDGAVTVDKYIKTTESYATATLDIENEINANAEKNKWYTVSGIDKLKKDTDYTITVKNTGTVYNPVFTVKFALTDVGAATYNLKGDYVDTLTFTINWAQQETILITPADVTAKTLPSDNEDAKKTKYTAAVKEALVKALPANMVEGTDYKAEFTPNVATKTVAVKLTLLNTEAYAIANNQTGAADVNDDKLNETINLEYAVTEEVASMIQIVPVLTAAKEITVDIYEDDKTEVKAEKAMAAVEKAIGCTIYSQPEEDKAVSDITESMTYGKDADYVFTTAFATNPESNKVFTADDVKPVITGTFTLKNAADYGFADEDKFVVKNDQGTVTATYNAVKAVDVTIIWNIVEKEEEETTTDKWIENEDGTYTWTAEDASLYGGEDASWTNLMLDLADYTELSNEDIASITVEFEVEGNANGAIGINGEGDAWLGSSFSATTPTAVIDCSEKALADYATQIQVQVFWAESGDVITVKSVTVEEKKEEVAETETAEITACVAQNGQIALNWAEVEGAQKYAIYMWTKGSGIKCVGARDAGVTGAYVKGLKNGTKYGFLVRTFNGEKWSAYEAADWAYATPYNLAKPAISACVPSAGKVALNWTSVKGAEKYAIYTYVDGKYKCVGGRAADVTGMYVRNLESGKKYGFLVRAYVDGKWTTYSEADIAYATIL